MALVGPGLDASAHRMVSQLADRAIDIRLVTFHGYVHDHEMLLARQVRAADDTRTSSAGPPTASDLHRKATEHGVAAIWQDARESLDYSVRAYYTKAGITYLQRTTTLPDGARVRGSHWVTIGELGEIRITFYPAAVDLCHEEFEQLRDAIRFEAEKPPSAPGTRRAPNQWYCRLDERSWQRGRARLIEFVRAVGNAWRKHERRVADAAGKRVATDVVERNDRSAAHSVVSTLHEIRALGVGTGLSDHGVPSQLLVEPVANGIPSPVGRANLVLPPRARYYRLR